MLSATAFACPQGTTLTGGTGANHKSGTCITVSKDAKYQAHVAQHAAKVANHDAKAAKRDAKKADQLAHSKSLKDEKMAK